MCWKPKHLLRSIAVQLWQNLLLNFLLSLSGAGTMVQESCSAAGGGPGVREKLSTGLLWIGTVQDWQYCLQHMMSLFWCHMLRVLNHLDQTCHSDTNWPTHLWLQTHSMKKVAATSLTKKAGAQAAVRGKKAGGRRKKVGAQKAVIYSRTSSKANAEGDTHHRQLKAGMKAFAACGLPRSSMSLQKVTECISGMLPLQKRKTLMKLVKGECSHIFVESVRSLARSSRAIEDLHQAAKTTGTAIIVADSGPDLFKLDATPAQNFQRRILAAVTEFERDVVVERLASGLKRKAQSLRASTGNMHPKVNGRKSHFEHAMEGCGCDMKKKKAMQTKLKALCKLQAKGELTWRQLAVKASKVMNLKKQNMMGKDAAITLSKKLGVVKHW